MGLINGTVATGATLAGLAVGIGAGLALAALWHGGAAAGRRA